MPNREVKELCSKNNNKIAIKKEGVHFDLKHMNRIEWDMENLEQFKKDLTNRIKANII